MGYARLYDGTAATDYSRAIEQIERLFIVDSSFQPRFTSADELLALVDSLSSGTLIESQRNTLSNLRSGIQYLLNISEVQLNNNSSSLPVENHKFDS